MPRPFRSVASAFVAALVGLVASASTTPVQAAYDGGRMVFKVRDPRIVESSGLVASSVHNDVFFTHNDSGDKARFFALDRSGCAAATFNLVGAAAIDWEDIARGPDGGQSVLWLGDIGDNTHTRLDGIVVYRVREPAFPVKFTTTFLPCPPTPPDQSIAWTSFRLSYPDGPHDAETLLADPRNGQLYVVTKTPAGVSTLYRAPHPLVPNAVNAMKLVGAVLYPPSTTLARGPAVDQQMAFDLAGRLMATGGDIAPDASRIVLRTYTDAWEWNLAPDGDISATLLAGTPTQIPLPYDIQGEAIAYARDGRSLLTTSEGLNAPAHRLSN